MSEINLSSAVRSSLSSLQTTANLLSSTQERLATGNRINSALDDPTAFFTAAALNDRASDLTTLLDEQGQAIQVIETADQGISAITDLVESARSIATQALQTDSATERATLAGQFDDILTQISDLAGDASFNGINLLDNTNSSDLEVIFNEDGSSSLSVSGFNFTDVETGLGLSRQGGATASTATLDISGLAAGDTLSISGGAAGTDDDISITIQGTDASAGTTAELDITTTELDPTNFGTAGDTLTITVGGTNIGSINVSDTGSITSLADLQSAIDGLTLPSGVDLTATDNAGTLELRSNSGDIVVNFDNAGGATGDVNLTTVGDTDGVAFAAADNGTTANVNAASIQAQITSAIAAADATAATGLSSTESSGTITLSSTGGTVTASEGATTISTAVNAFVAGGNEFASNDDINAALTQIDSALGTLRTSASTLGTNLSTIQIRSDFTENLIDTLEVGASNLTLADLNEEGANLLTLQTRQALASTSLSFATQADQSILSLF